ncbi:MAG: hypothetical protein BAA00_16875 [Parageobacillus thermoglucosidasius]|nr:hypothetical protein [Parageobacillus thermoglucosidasius]OUM88966.1 MAG: hypothetical protein BAA00_16875 [Parageobacillus thermoglucosidasius]
MGRGRISAGARPILEQLRRSFAAIFGCRKEGMGGFAATVLSLAALIVFLQRKQKQSGWPTAYAAAVCPR